MAGPLAAMLCTPPLVRAALHAALAPALIVAAAIAAYHNSIPGILVFDDIGSVVENRSIRQLRPLGTVLSPPNHSGVGGRPVANLTFALNRTLGGGTAGSFHAGNLALHVVAALTLFGVVRRTLRRPCFPARVSAAAAPLAGVTTLLWVVHPLTTAAVNYVSQRTELLMALFCLLTLYCFIRSVEVRSRSWAILSVTACALGMASKEVMAIAPGLILLYDRTFVAGSFGAALRRHVGLYAGLAGTWGVLGWLVVTSELPERGVGFDLGVAWADYALTQARAVLLYLQLCFWPHPLVFDYGWAFERRLASAAPYLAGTLALLSMVVVALWRQRTLGFAAFGAFLLLAPTSSLVPIIQQPIAENRMYMPLALVIAATVVATFQGLGRSALVPVAAAMVGLGGLTLQRNVTYQSEVELWSDTVARRPDNARAHCNLSAALLRAGRVPEGIAAARAALALAPAYPDAHHNLAVGLAGTGRIDEALGHYAAALRGNPGSAATHQNFGDALFALGRHAEAIQEYETALAGDPQSAGALNNLSVVRLKCGEVAKAIEHAREAVRLDARFADAWYNLGNALAQTGDAASAIASFETALKLRPDSPRPTTTWAS